MNIYHFIYKTTHINGNYYYGNKPVFSPESNKKKSLTKMGKNNPMFGKAEASKHLNVSNEQCRYCDIVTTIGNIGRWHNDRCKLVPISSV
jgi:hypothetical protein